MMSNLDCTTYKQVKIQFIHKIQTITTTYIYCGFVGEIRTSLYIKIINILYTTRKTEKNKYTVKKIKILALHSYNFLTQFIT